MMTRYLGLVLAFSFLVTALDARGSGDDGSTDPVIIVGIVRVVGNEPFAVLVITDEKGQDYLIPENHEEQFRPLVQQVVQVRSRISVREIRTADGKRITDEHTLVNPVIVEN